MDESEKQQLRNNTTSYVIEVIRKINDQIIKEIIESIPSVHIAKPFNQRELNAANKGSYIKFLNDVINTYPGYSFNVNFKIDDEPIIKNDINRLEEIGNKLIEYSRVLTAYGMEFFCQIPYMHDEEMRYVNVFKHLDGTTLKLRSFHTDKSVKDFITPSLPQILHSRKLSLLQIFNPRKLSLAKQPMYMAIHDNIYELHPMKSSDKAEEHNCLHIDFRTKVIPPLPTAPTATSASADIPLNFQYRMTATPMFTTGVVRSNSVITARDVAILNSILSKSFIIKPQQQQPPPRGGGDVTKVHVLGRSRKIHKQGRIKYVMYKKELIKLSDAKKLDRKKR